LPGGHFFAQEREQVSSPANLLPQLKDGKSFGEDMTDGFIHCSPIEYMWRVAPNFQDVTDELVLLCIDEDKLESQVRWEDGENCGRSYPHVYGIINIDAVTKVLAFLRDENGAWIKNEELMDVPNR